MSLKLCSFVGALAFLAARACAQEDAAGRAIALPTNLSDNTGAVYTIYANGSVQQQGGNLPMFGQVGQLTVNGSQANGGRMGFNPGMPMAAPNGPNATSARIDDKTGELTIANLSIGGLSVTRRIFVDKETSVIRFVDTFKNPTATEKPATCGYTSNFNFGIQNSRLLSLVDGKKKDQPLGWSGLTGNNRAVYAAWGLSGGKVAPKVTYPEGSNMLQATVTLTVPPNKEMSILHYYGSAESVDRGVGEITAVKFNKVLASLPPAVRRTIVNLPFRGTSLPDDLEFLRGDQTDVIETVTGDILCGTFQDKTLALKTFFGPLELPAGKVLSIVTVGKQRPQHLLLTDEGELFGGTLDMAALSLQLASGQTVKVPVTQIQRAGTKRGIAAANSTEEEVKPLTKPMLVLRSGQRLAITAPAGPLEFASRYGPLSIPANKIALVTLAAPSSAVHQVTLVDGSKFAAILIAPKFDFTLDGAVGAKAISVPASLIASLRPTPAAGKDDDDIGSASGPTARTFGDDVFVGSPSGTLQLDTAFETVDIPAEGIRSIRRGPGDDVTAPTYSNEMRFTQWDGTVVTGVPRVLALRLNLVSGISISMPVDLLSTFDNPKPRPSQSMADNVKALVSKLNDDDFKVRESSQAALIASGPAIAPLLREIKDAQPPQPPEAQQRIDQILAQLEK